MNNDVAKKGVHNELVKKLMPWMLVNLSIKQIMMLKSKILRDKIPSITNLATTAALIAVEDKMLMLIYLSKKHIWYKISEVERNYFTPSDFNQFNNDIPDAKVKDTKTVNESDISKFINNANLDEKIETLATIAELKTDKDKK